MAKKNVRWATVKDALAWFEGRGGKVGQGVIALPAEVSLRVWACVDFLTGTGRYKIVRGA